jgi:hypothetical protein
MEMEREEPGSLDRGRSDKSSRRSSNSHFAAPASRLFGRTPSNLFWFCAFSLGVHCPLRYSIVIFNATLMQSSFHRLLSRRTFWLHVEIHEHIKYGVSESESCGNGVDDLCWMGG